MLAVRAIHDMPWRERLVGGGQRPLEGPFDRPVVARQPAILRRHAPASGLVRMQPGESLLLRRGSDVQMHLAHHHAVAHQHLLELPHARDALAQLCRIRTGLHAETGRSKQQVLVPAAMQDRDPAFRRHQPPVTPQGRPFAFDVVRRVKAVDGGELRIEPAEQFVDDFAATRRRNTRHDHHHGVPARPPQRELRIEQRVLQPGQGVLVLEPRQAAAAQRFVQPALGGHGTPQRRRSRASGTCCVTQWKLPPPSRISRPGTPTTSRFGNRSCSLRKASRSRRGSSNGATMRRLPM